MFKIFIIISFFIFSDLSMARAHKNKKHSGHGPTPIKKSTVFSMCSRSLTAEKKNLPKGNNTTQAIIVAVETLSESQCKTLGKNKAEQYAKAGWKCVGKNNEELFSCEGQRGATFANYKGIKLDHLTFTNLQKHRALLAYINPNSNEICHEDKAELVLAGVRDAVCHNSILNFYEFHRNRQDSWLACSHKDRHLHLPPL